MCNKLLQNGGFLYAVHVKINCFYVNFHTKLLIFSAANRTKLHESFLGLHRPFSAANHNSQKTSRPTDNTFQVYFPYPYIIPEAAVPDSNKLPAHSSSYLIISYLIIFCLIIFCSIISYSRNHTATYKACNTFRPYFS